MSLNQNNDIHFFCFSRDNLSWYGKIFANTLTDLVLVAGLMEHEEAIHTASVRCLKVYPAHNALLTGSDDTKLVVGLQYRSYYYPIFVILPVGNNKSQRSIDRLNILRYSDSRSSDNWFCIVMISSDEKITLDFFEVFLKFIQSFLIKFLLIFEPDIEFYLKTGAMIMAILLRNPLNKRPCNNERTLYLYDEIQLDYLPLICSSIER